jgi:methylated-DNA-[protein]-cysteine S-methyltransferase
MQTAAEMNTELKTKTISSPVGDIVIYATNAALVALFIDDQKHQIAYDAKKVKGAHAILDSAERDLRAYFKGNHHDPKTPMTMNGTPFQMKVWRALTTIPFGETWSYGQLAKKIGSPDAVRAVGTANSRNKISILVPCHRVIGADGSLTGYAGGVENKKWLLDHEAKQRGLFASP